MDSAGIEPAKSSPGTYRLSAVRKLGLDDEATLELMTVVDFYNGLNTFNDGLQVELDEKPWYGCGVGA